MFTSNFSTRETYEKTIIFVLMLLLIGCTKNDEPYISDEEMLKSGSYALIVQITEVSETIQEYYLDGQVPKTVFNATCLYALYGECEESIKISRKGGYDNNNNFIGVVGEGTGVIEYIKIADQDSNYNLFEISNFYIVIVDVDSNDFITRRYYSLFDYSKDLGPLSQIGDSGLIIFSLIDNINIMEENKLE